MTIEITPAPPSASPTGIKVLVVGLGLAGITAAIECHRRGHSVILFEKVTKLRHDAGDGIMIAPNAARIIGKWDDQVNKELAANCCDATHADMLDHRDRCIVRHELPGKGQGLVTNRGKVVCVLYEYAKRLGIDVRLGSRITDYWENEDGAGVVVNGEERVAGDCVVCADGVHSMARGAIVKQDVERKETGWATFRAHMETEPSLAKDSQANWVLEGTDVRDRTYAWVGEGINFAIMTLKHGKELVWMTTHQDRCGASETWDKGDASLDDVVQVFSDWPGIRRIEAVIRHTRPEKLVNHSLVFRPPLKTWISPGGRAIVIGDAAHPVYPVVAQGGSQGIEDGAVLAAALDLAGKDRIPLGLQVTEKIRYPRATVIQLGSSTLQAELFTPDWDAVEKNPDMMRFPNPDWIFNHDCVEYTFKEFDAVVECIREGREHVPTNIPVDGVYKVEDTFEG